MEMFTFIDLVLTLIRLGFLRLGFLKVVFPGGEEGERGSV